MKKNCIKRYILKSMTFILALFTVTGAFTACGKTDREDIERELSQGDAVGEKIPESLSYTVESGGRDAVKVEAEVMIV